HLHHELLLTSTTTKMTSCHPNHGLQDLISEPEVRPVILDHLQHHLVLPGTTMMTSCPPNLGPQIVNCILRTPFVVVTQCSTLAAMLLCLACLGLVHTISYTTRLTTAFAFLSGWIRNIS